MPKFLFTYSGGHGMPETDAEKAEVMKAWGGWFAELGDSLVDGGNPTAQRKTVKPGGGVSDGGEINGYSLITAGSLDAAVEAAKGCPVLSNGGEVEVGEAIEM